MQLPGLAFHTGLTLWVQWDTELALCRLTSSPVPLASRSYCKGCHSQNLSPVFAQCWCLEAPACSAEVGETLGLVLGWGIFQPWRKSIILGDVTAFLWCDWMMGRTSLSRAGKSCVSEPLYMTGTEFWAIH